MKLTREQVMQIADLAKLDLTDAEIDLYADQLSAVLNYADRLSALNTDDIPPTATVLPIRSVMRADEVRPSLTPEQVTRNAPDAIENQFRVDVVLEDE